MGCSGQELLDVRKTQSEVSRTDRASLELSYSQTPFLGPTLLTSQNRDAPTMMGGWNPQLRSIFDMVDGKKWFAAESGHDVYHNTSMNYYRLDDGSWNKVGSVWISPGVQQNMATISDGKYLYSYGVNEATGWVMECTFNIEKPKLNLNSCNAILPGGVAVIAPGSNYVGAAMRSDKTRIVWWTRVGGNGAGGTFSYTYNTAGKGWNGPVRGGLGGYTSLGYIAARFDKDNNLRMTGEMFVGSYPSGSFRAGVTRIKLGNAAVWHTTLREAQRPADLYYDAELDKTYVLAGTQARGPLAKANIGLYEMTADTWLKPVTAVKNIPNTLRMRFAQYKNETVVIRDNAALGTVEIITLKDILAGPNVLDNSVPRISVPRPAAVLQDQVLTAIWTTNPSMQLTSSTPSFSFAVCGAYPATDHNVWSYSEQNANFPPYTP